MLNPNNPFSEERFLQDCGHMAGRRDAVDHEADGRRGGGDIGRQAARRPTPFAQARTL